MGRFWNYWAYHKDSYIAHRKDWTTGFEGRYRRTHSPSAPSQRNLQLARPRDHESSMNIRNLQRSGISSKINHSSNGDSMQMRSSVSTSNLSPVSDANRDSDVINNNNLCKTSRSLAQSADWSSHNTSITVTFSSEELKAFKAKKSSLQLSAFRKYNTKDSRHHNLRDVGGSVQSLASSSEASQSSTPSDESRFSSSWKTSLDSLNLPPSEMSDFSCHTREISVDEPLHRLKSQDIGNVPTNVDEPLNIITTPSDKYNGSYNTFNSSPVNLNNISINGERLISHDGPVTAHPATVTEESQPSSPISLRDRVNATSTPKSSPISSPKSSPTYPTSPNSLSGNSVQPVMRPFKENSASHLSYNIPIAPNTTLPVNNTILSNSALSPDSGTTPAPSYLKLLSPIGTSCSMAAVVIPEDQEFDRSNIVTLSYGRKPSREEIDYNRISMEFASCCNYDKELKNIIAPGKDHKTIASYMQDLFSLELRKDLLCSNHSKHPDLRGSGNKFSIKLKNNTNNTIASLPIDCPYLTVSDCKASLLSKLKLSSSIPDTFDAQALAAIKESLIKSLTSKVKVLKEEQNTVKNEISGNSNLGSKVTDMIQNRAKTAELNRYKLHVEEIEKIISLLLVLSGRLARAENALLYFPKSSSNSEKKTLESKRDKLKEQLDEAQKLKESIDRRAIQVSKFLMQYLNDSEFAEYDHYVKMKAKLFMDSREIDEKVRLGEEQLQALKSA